MPRVKPLNPARSEAQVTTCVLDAARCLGIQLERRNVGGMHNASGRYVAFGTPGDSDFVAVLDDGRALALEIKRGDFDPAKVRGSERERFGRQLAKLRAVNDRGGVGLWVRDGGDFLRAMARVREGWRVEIDADGWCTVTDEPR